MLFSMSFGTAGAYPETEITLLDIRGDAAYLGIHSFLGTRTPTDSRGHLRPFRVRTRILSGAMHEDIVTDLMEVMLVEHCHALAPGGSGAWQIVTGLPPCPNSWKAHDTVDLADWAVLNDFAIAVPHPNYSTITSFPPTTIPGLAGSWIVLELN